MRVADDQADAGEFCDLFGGALRVASGDDDAGVGVLALHAADGGAGVLIGRSGDGAGVEDDDGGVCGFVGARESLLFELTFEGRAIGLRGAAAEVFDVISGHMLMVPHAPRVRA